MLVLFLKGKTGHVRYLEKLSKTLVLKIISKLVTVINRGTAIIRGKRSVFR